MLRLHKRGKEISAFVPEATVEQKEKHEMNE